MLRSAASFALGSAILLSACAAEPVTLTAQPIDRAATCGAVAIAEAKATAVDSNAPLPLDAQEHVLHYALLAGSEGESVSLETAQAVIRRIPQVQLKEGEWQDLLPLCREAYHDAWTFNVTLPEDRFDSKLQCNELGKFLTTSLQREEPLYAARLAAYREMARKLEERLGPGLRVRAGDDIPAQQEVRRRALAAASKLGRPAQVMEQCVERYG